MSRRSDTAGEPSNSGPTGPERAVDASAKGSNRSGRADEKPGKGKSDPTRPKEIANPFSTGGGGVNFETRIQAAFALLMLAGGQCPCLPRWPIESVTLQARRSGFEIDDLVVSTREPHSAAIATFRGQIKHELTLTKGDETFAEVVGAAWRDFNSNFYVGHDAIAIITGPLSATDQQFQTLLEWARTSATADEYFEKVDRAQFSSKTKKNKQDALNHHLTVANNGRLPPPREIWAFMKSLYMLQFDFDIAHGVNASLVNCIISQFDTQAGGLWAQLLDAVQSLNQNAGTITRSTLPADVVSAFNRRPVVAFSQVMRQEGEEAAEAAEPPTPSAHPTELALAQLIGSWNDRYPGDREAVATMAREPYEAYIGKLRIELRRPGTPLRYRNGVWSVTNRAQSWHKLGDMIFDDEVGLLGDAATKALSIDNAGEPDGIAEDEE